MVSWFIIVGGMTVVKKPGSLGERFKRTKSRISIFGFSIGLLFFVTANLVAVHFRSIGGLFEGLGLVNHWVDDIHHIGFPFQFFEEGGYAYRRIFSRSALLLDIAVAVVFAVATGFVYEAWRRHLKRNSLPLSTKVNEESAAKRP